MSRVSRGMHNFDAVKLAKPFDKAPMISERDGLMESEHVAAVFDVVHWFPQKGRVGLLEAFPEFAEKGSGTAAWFA